MKKYPQLEIDTFSIKEKVPWGDDCRIYSLEAAISLYNELREAYLGLRQVLQVAHIVRRLPGERRVPMEAGLYLARGKEHDFWRLIVEVYGDAPFFRVREWKSDSCGPGGWLDVDAIWFGPCLAGPDWRRIPDKHLHRVPEADVG